MKIKPPCKDCEHRSVGCHTDCDLYIHYKKEFESEKEKISLIRNKEKLINDYVCDRKK